MGPFPRILLSACLNLMKWLFFVTAGLVLILMVVQHLRGDAEAAPMQLAVFAVVVGALGWASGKASLFFIARP